MEKQIKDDIVENTHKLITKPSGYELSSKEMKILKLVLRYSVATRPVESEMIVILEAIWDQIKNANVIKSDLSEQRIKTALRAFTLNYIDVDEKQFGIDGKRLKVLKELRKKITILKPDKGQGVVLLKREDYTNRVETLLVGRSKFKRTHKDQTIMRLNTVQSYVNKLFNRGEINEEQKKLMRPKAAQIDRVYELPKIHKPFQHLPKFRLIIDTINTPYQGIGKPLTSLLNPLAQNEYVVKDSFEAAVKINSISFDNMSDEYTFVQLNSCNSSCCHSKDNRNQTNFSVLSEFTSKPLQ